MSIDIICNRLLKVIKSKGGIAITIKELYQWAKENDCEDYEVNIECYDEDGDISEIWLDDVWLLKVRHNNSDVLIKCAE